MMRPLNTRRQFLFTASAAAAATALPVPALALNSGQAQGLVTSAVNDINAIIASGGSEAAMIRQFEGIFDRYGDTVYIASFALGNDRRSASQAQIQAFVGAFRTYIAAKYGRRFREFIGGQITVVGAKAVNSWIEVETTVTLRGQSPFRVDFHVSDRPGKPVFFNLIIEGVNMLLSERTEIGAMLDRRGGNLDALINDLRNT
ncbi:phospholipid-binding protein MlaC [Octadecabacter sp. R77987]|uniref:MlaC/ttg2D family ABC transporter substrate-binding protein n=1 Tax=Octadecabacter sp. R77987 TaxID=3093874 RepID=UPI00366C4733